MPSHRARLLKPVLRWLLKQRLRPAVPLWQQRATVSIWAAFGHLPRGTLVERLELAGRPAERIRPKLLTSPTGEVLLLHGGGYCFGGLFSYRELAARLAHTAQRAVTVLDYRLAPEHPYPAAVDDAAAAWLELTKSDDPPATGIVGDSAGGGLTLATCLRLQTMDVPLPRCLGLISPWVDLTHTGESLQRLSDRDPVISEASLRQCAGRYAAGRDLRLPELSPLFADLSGLPPTLIQVGSDEILLDDAIRLAEQIGSTATLEITPDLWHVWHLFASLVPESQTAIERLGQFLRQHAAAETAASARDTP
ncbi:MAG: alpha/beta hydrolase [Planctomycetaceae bacterium]